MEWSCSIFLLCRTNPMLLMVLINSCWHMSRQSEICESSHALITTGSSASVKKFFASTEHASSILLAIAV